VIILDSDVAIDILRSHPPAMQWVSAVKDIVALPGFAVMELYQGCYNKQQRANLERELQRFLVVWPAESGLEEAVKVHASAHLTHSMGILDALIGATAKSFGLPIQSFSGKHFAGFPGLQVIEPYVR
jgi:predicted nucleic acid-binding protein